VRDTPWQIIRAAIEAAISNVQEENDEICTTENAAGRYVCIERSNGIACRHG
jgi:hypothetical protein